MPELEELPLVIEEIIMNYADGATHYDKFKKSLEEIKKTKYKITNDKIGDNDIISTMKRDGKLSFYRLGQDENGNKFLEAENSLIKSKTWIKYWCFSYGKLEVFDEIKS